MEIAKKLLMGFITLMLVMTFIPAGKAGTETPTCTWLGGTTGTFGTTGNETENVTFTFGITTGNVNFTNVTFSLVPAPNGNSSIYFTRANTGINITASPLFTIANMPEGTYNLSARAEYLNYSVNSQDSMNLTAMSAICAPELSVNVRSDTTGAMVIQVQQQAGKARLSNVFLGFLVIVIVALLYNLKK